MLLDEFGQAPAARGPGDIDCRDGPPVLAHHRRADGQVPAVALLIGPCEPGASCLVYEPEDPRIIPIKADKQYRSWNTVEHPEVNAAVIYMMDVSGSMTDEQKEIVRTEAFWERLVRQLGAS